MSKPMTPQCLHVPALYAEDALQLKWAAVEGAARYTVECSMDESFEDAQRGGLSWSELDELGQSWVQAENEQSWAEWESRPSLGQAWMYLDSAGLDWGVLDGRELTWDELDNRPVDLVLYDGPGEPLPLGEKGCIWMELNDLDRDWAAADTEDLSWQQMEERVPPGMTWNDLEMRHLDWGGVDDRDFTWAAFDAMEEGTRAHLSCALRLPREAMHAWLCIRAWSSDGMASDCLSTEGYPVIVREVANMRVEPGKVHTLQLEGQDLRRLKDMRLTALYDPECLRLNKAGVVRDMERALALPELLEEAPGRLAVHLRRDVPDGLAWDGMLLWLEFTGLAPADTTVHLERQCTLCAG